MRSLLGLAFHLMITILCWPSLGRASDQRGAAFIVDLKQDRIDGEHLGRSMFWYRGEEGIESVSSADFQERFTRGTSDVINSGYTSDNFWYRLQFHNPELETQRIHLHDPHNVYDEFEVYLGSRLLGSLHNNDPLHIRIVSVDLPPQTTSTLYIRKKTNAVVQQTTFTFWLDYEALRRSIHTSELRFQTVVTSLLMSVFLTLALLFAYRKRIYVFYLGYLLSFVMFATWVWSVFAMPTYSRYGGVVSLLCVAFTALFVNEFLEIKQHSRLMHNLFLLFAGLSFAAMALELINPIWRAFAGSMLSIIIQASTVIFGTLLFIRYRYPHVLIFNTAFGSFFFSGFIQLLIWMGIIDSAENLILFYGVAAENILMVLAIGHRIVVTEASRKHNDNLLVHSFEQLSKVFYPHQIMQMRTGKTVEETMPVGEKNACILYFQIVGGSSLISESYEACVENFMDRCRQLMMERYDPVAFSADAYIIREMGDTFLCSVGYPFRQIGPLKSDAAVELAEKLIQEFEVMREALDAPQKIYCSIGIVRGTVKSFFCRSGRIRDDLWGRAIVQASAYGAASRQLFKELGAEPDNIIILHDAVFESLSRTRRKGFAILDLPLASAILGQDLDGKTMGYRIVRKAADALPLRKAG
jgi:hypothetical protein